MLEEEERAPGGVGGGGEGRRFKQKKGNLDIDELAGFDATFYLDYTITVMWECNQLFRSIVLW